MTEKIKTIAIVGDVAIDHLYHTIPQKDQGENWQLFPALHTTLMPGGAYVLADFVKNALKLSGSDAFVTEQIIPQDLGGLEARKMIQAKILLARFKEVDANGNKKETLRVEKYFGYSAQPGESPELPSLKGNFDDADMIVLDDAGNGFRNNLKTFPATFASDVKILIYKMSRPLVVGALWEKVIRRKEDWVLILHANDIRLCKNVNVSKSLSWERTAMEMVYQLKRNPSLAELQKVPYLIILFGMDGALFASGKTDEKPLLLFDAQSLEGGFASSLKGNGLSTVSAFTAALIAGIVQHGTGGMAENIKQGLSAMRNLLKHGFSEMQNEVFYQVDKIFGGEFYKFSECIVQTPDDFCNPDPNYWRILDEKTKLSKPLVTVDIVKNKSPKILGEIPVGRYCKLQTIDRSEIEQYNAIKNLILEFLNDPKTNRPLCIAVFGPPGSGKSFGIKQVLDSLGRSDIPTMTFNISQYKEYEDLIADFHKVRDKVLIGAIPVAFFDEFDSDKDHRPMGWLKYFLSPMQDGEFKEGETIHPIGKSIFVFAGGTRSSFEDFEQNDECDLTGSEQLSEDEMRKAHQKRMELFREAKGPDFVSRLRGFINILGLNPNHRAGRIDNTFMIRRAKILRGNFEMTEKTKQLINSKGVLQIDESVLRAMLNIPEYKHGNRSMNAITDMSRLTGKTKFDLSALPIPEQLNMHVDANVFMWLATTERFYSLLSIEDRHDLVKGCPMAWEQQLIERIARQMNEDYCRQRLLHGHDTPTVVTWTDLPENKKRSNEDEAADIPVKLCLVGHGIRRIKNNEPVPTPDLSDDDIDILAKEEHKRWCREQKIQGWKFGEIRNDTEKVHPSLVSWKHLSEKERNKDREGIYAIPRILKELGFCIYRFEAYDAFHEVLIRRIAVAIHEDYCRKRKLEGQTVATNPTLVPFEQLSGDMREANIDSARTIPRKLKLLGIELWQTLTGIQPSFFELTTDEIETLSKWEHARWNWQKILQGWSHGPVKDETAKTHPYLLPWNQLPDNIKEYDRENVRLMMLIINEIGCNVVRNA